MGLFNKNWLVGLAYRAVPGVEACGGVALSYSVDSLNPFAVDAALKLREKVVWMPSVVNDEKLAGYLQGRWNL